MYSFLTSIIQNCSHYGLLTRHSSGYTQQIEFNLIEIKFNLIEINSYGISYKPSVKELHMIMLIGLHYVRSMPYY